MKASKDFFSLPQEVKNETLKIPPVEQGYVRPGQEIFDAKEDWKKVKMLNFQNLAQVEATKNLNQ
jgi:isopenicillin N synthase-like dioxygenase